MTKVRVTAESTPNPASMRFVFDREIASEVASFEDSKKADRSPLAVKLFGFPWVAGVLIGPNFVTITKQDWVDWEMLSEPLTGLLAEHLESGQPILKEPGPKEMARGHISNADVQSDTGVGSSEESSEIVLRIREILDSEIRPAVAMDGGDITFERFTEGRLYISMHGACSGCPSSTITLKEGIESRLREIFPEISEVISIN